MAQASEDENELSVSTPLSSQQPQTTMTSIEILTTTVGSLPRPPWMVPYLRGEKELPPDWEETLHKETVKVMKEQLAVGLKVINDGELGRGDYVSEARKRMSGFDAEAIAPGAADLEEATEYSD